MAARPRVLDWPLRQASLLIAPGTCTSPIASTTVAGTGIFGFGGDGGPATAAVLAGPHGLAGNPAGLLHISDTGNSRVRRLNADGTITTGVGAGTRGFAGEGGPAAGARSSGAHGIAFDAAGNLFVADRSNNRVRKVATTGTIATVAGNAIAGYSGDGGPGTAAMLNLPRAVAVDVAGNLYVA